MEVADGQAEQLAERRETWADHPTALVGLGMLLLAALWLHWPELSVTWLIATGLYVCMWGPRRSELWRGTFVGLFLAALGTVQAMVLLTI